jgi:hypothetical protein
VYTKRVLTQLFCGNSILYSTIWTIQCRKLTYFRFPVVNRLILPPDVGDGMSHEQRSQVEDLLFAFGHENTMQQQEQIYKEYTQFCVSALLLKEADSFRLKMLKKETKTVMQYWDSDGNNWRVLQKVALQVFSMVCSSAALEHIFSFAAV